MAAQNFTNHAYYKYYDGSQWQIVSLKSSAADVGVTASRKFITTDTKVNGVAFTLDSSGNGATVTIAGDNITGGASVDSGSLTYITASDTVASALGKLDQAAKAAYDNIPSGILTEDNYADTLGNIYQPKGSYQAADADLTAIAALSGTSGFLKKTAANTWALDTNAYVPTGRTINGKALSSNVTLTGADVAVSASDTTKLSVAIAALQSTAAGLTHTYALDVTAENNQSNCYNKIFNDAVTNNIISSLNDYWVATITVGGSIPAGSHGASMPSGSASLAYFKTVGGTNILLSDLKVGDTIFLQQVNLPDVWVTNVTTSGSALTIEFAVLESFKLVWGAINDTPTTLNGYGITDAKIVDGVITLGSNSITPLTSHQSVSSSNPTASWGAEVTVGTVGETALKFKMPANPNSDTKNTAGSTDTSSKIFLIGATSQAANPQTYSQDTAYVGTDGCVYSGGKKTSTRVVTVGTTAPSSPATGDIWIDTTA